MNDVNQQIKKILLKKYEDSFHQLQEKNLPLIFDIHSCSEAIGIKAYYLRGIINDTSKLYRVFRIPKQNGDERIIESPKPKLLQCQRWIVYNILNQVSLHHSAKAYRKNIDILSNTEIHLGQKHLLKLDLKDFFHSIKMNRVIAVFKKIGYLQDAALILAKICCHQNRLSQGSATSPILSNIIATRLDKRLNGLAKKYNLNYTRYSDDITFSGEHIQKNIIEIVEEIIKNEGFVINKKKTRLYIKQGKRIITGISVSEATPKIPREKKRLIKQEVYELLKINNIQEIIHSLNKDVFFLESLKGKLHFWCHVEKDALFPKQALEKLVILEKEFNQSVVSV